MTFCKCKECKRMRRQGKILGTRMMGFRTDSFTGAKEYYYGPVSEYVNFPKFMKGRLRKDKREYEE